MTLQSSGIQMTFATDKQTHAHTYKRGQFFLEILGIQMQINKAFSAIFGNFFKS